MNTALVQAGASYPVEISSVPVNGTNEVQLLTIGGTPTGGTFKFSFEGIISIAITWSATTNTLLANIQAALDAHPSLGTNGCVASAGTVSSGIGTVILTFGANRAKQSIGSLISTPTNLNSLTGTAPTLAITRTTTGVDATARGVAPGTVLVNSTSGRAYVNAGTALQPDWVRTGADGRYTLEKFNGIPKVSKNDGYSDPTGVAGDVNLLYTDRNGFEYHIKGTQTILKPGWDANGLDLEMDATNNDGVELTQGITALSRGAFVIGTDGPFSFSVTFKVSDVSGTDDCAIGFRKAEAYQANFDDYNDLASLNVQSGNVFIETIKTNAATVSTDTTNDWADGETHTLTVLVSAAGVVTYQIDGAAPTVVAAYTFTSGLTVLPFFFLLNDTDVVDHVYLTRWEVGLY